MDICEKCGGEGTLYTSKYGGNDPDVWPVGTCEECEGTGKCQYAEAVAMPEYRCVGVCQYAAATPSQAVAFSEALELLNAVIEDDRVSDVLWNQIVAFLRRVG